MSNSQPSQNKNFASASASASLTKAEKKREHFPHHLMSDFQRFVGHEYFSHYLFLVFSVKAIHQSLLAKTVPNESEVLVALGERQGEDELQDVARFIQSRLIPKLDNRAFILNVHCIPMGMFRGTDSLIYESISILRGEIKRCLQWYSDSASDQPLSNSAKIKRMKPNPKKGGKGKSESIAIKYSKGQTDILNGWMIGHRSHPFPTSTEIADLGQATHLSYSQVVNWTTNVRKRNLKATVEKGKKPHHFLDFLFLADNRDLGTAAPLAPTRKTQFRKSVAKHGSAIGKRSRRPKSFTSKKSYDSEQSVSTTMSAITAKASNATSEFDFHLKPFHAGVLETPKGVREESRINPMSLNFNSFTGFIPPFHSGLMMPKVTPPRYCPNPPIYPCYEARFGPSYPRLPYYHQRLECERNQLDDNALLHHVTQNGLVNTPKRRGSEDDITIDLDDSQLMVQLSDVFKEREADNNMEVESNTLDDCASLSTNDIDALMSCGEKDDLMNSDDIEMFGEGLANDFIISI